MKSQIKKCRIADFSELGPTYFNVTLPALAKELFQLKLPLNKINLANLLIKTVQEAELSLERIISLAATLELENLSRQKQGVQWQALRISCDLVEGDILFRETLRRAIKSRQEDAKILMKISNRLMWLAVLYKNPDNENDLLEPPFHLVISDDFQYLFSRKKVLPLRLSEAFKVAAKCRKIQPLHLAGRDVTSLLMLLRGRESTAVPRPTFAPQTPKVGDIGCDFTSSRGVKHYTKQCLGDNIQLEQYTVEPANKRWQGDTSLELRLIEFKSEVTFSGNVPALFAALPSAGVCCPPFPDYIRDFSVLGRSRVSSST